MGHLQNLCKSKTAEVIGLERAVQSCPIVGQSHFFFFFFFFYNKSYVGKNLK
jgi:hypothetical protein